MKVVKIADGRVREELEVLADETVTAAQRDEDSARERAELEAAVVGVNRELPTGVPRLRLRVLPGGRSDSVALSWPDGSEAA